MIQFIVLEHYFMTEKYNVIYVPGTWDLFHIGHLRLLRRAKKITNCLIAGVDTDKSVKRDKGGLPVIPYKERIEMLESCQYVDEVTWNIHTVPPVKRLRELKIEAVVLADSWKRKYLTGKKEAEIGGIELIYFPYTKSVSTTKIKERIRKNK